MRRALLLALATAGLLSVAALAQTVLQEPGAILGQGNPGEPTTGAGEPPSPQSVPEGATRPEASDRPRQRPPGAIEVDPAEPGPPVNVGRTPAGGPVIGTDRLLTSLAELDRPLTPEEITAYAATVQRAIPLRPELIADFRRRLNDAARAQAAPPTGVRPQSLTDAVRISLSAGDAPATILTAPGTVSVVSFFDRTGAPWPVAAYVIGNESAFQVYPMQEGSHELALSPLVTHGYSNLVVSLVDADQPIVLDVETNEERAPPARRRRGRHWPERRYRARHAASAGAALFGWDHDGDGPRSTHPARCAQAQHRRSRRRGLQARRADVRAHQPHADLAGLRSIHRRSRRHPRLPSPSRPRRHDQPRRGYRAC